MSADKNIGALNKKIKALQDEKTKLVRERDRLKSEITSVKESTKEKIAEYEDVFISLLDKLNDLTNSADAQRFCVKKIRGLIPRKAR